MSSKAPLKTNTIVPPELAITRPDIVATSWGRGFLRDGRPSHQSRMVEGIHFHATRSGEGNNLCLV